MVDDKEIIETLKLALIEERAAVLMWCDDPATIGEDYTEGFRALAVYELALQFPDIFSKEKI